MPGFLKKKPAVCAAVKGSSIDDFLAIIKEIKEADLVEVRADSLEDPSPKKVKKLLESIRHVTNLPLILTNRVLDEGGEFSGSEDERLLILEENMDLADAIDIELSTEKKRRDKLVEKAKEKQIPVIISAHDFEKTPDEVTMLKMIATEFRAGANVAKIAVMAHSNDDILKVLNVTHEASELGNICTIAMGDAGKLTRVVAPLLGSCITYATAGEPTAPGQLSVHTVNHLLEVLK